MIPDFQSIMLPLIKQVVDGKEYSTKAIHDDLAKHFKLSEDELNQFLSSGNQRIFSNRVFWAKAHLKMAGLLENTKRGHFKITPLGKEALSKEPSLINISYLKQFPGYKENISGSKADDPLVNSPSEPQSILETPQESLDRNFIRIKENLKEELLSKIKVCSPFFFEKLVVELLIKMGYGDRSENAGLITKKTGDEGIDGIIKQDPLGLDLIYIQAKKWEGVIGRPELQKFAGALAGQGAKKGVFITTSRFSQEALLYLSRNEMKIVLIDGEQLTTFMIDYNLGVSVEQTYEVKKIDSDYFEED